MESLKPILLLIVLSGIGYLVYVALNRAPSSEPVLESAPAWNQPTKPEPGSPASPLPSTARPPQYSNDLVTPPSSALPPHDSATTPPSLGPGSDANSLVTPPASSTPPTLPSAPIAAGPSNVYPSSPPLTDPAQSQNNPWNNDQSSGPAYPSNNGTLPPSNAAADPELARQRHEFESAMRRAQAEIQQNKLVDALRELSPWYDQPSVPAEQQAELGNLLGQLAGTVVYSREHWLYPEHVVQPGETLDSIGQQLQVPWELLAKINGIANPSALVVGEKLKVVRGPFHAKLNRTHNQLALFVDDLYAGRFDVQTSGDVAQIDGTFPVTKFAADHPSNSLRQHYISLGGNLFLRLADGGVTPQAGTMQIGERDLNDVFDILSDRSQVTIRR